MTQNADINQFVSSCYCVCASLILSFYETMKEIRSKLIISSSDLFDGKS